MIKQCKNLFKIWILVFVLVFETAFAGYLPAYAVSVSDNTVNSETKATEDLTENEKETEPFIGASGESGDLTWSISPEGHLTISGSGDYEYIYVNSRRILPWCQYADYILTADINIYNITDMSYMFSNCTNLSSVDFNNTDSSNVTDMSGMFNNCSSLQSINLSKSNTSNVTDMSWMFYNCSSLQSIKVSGGYFNTSNVTTMECMFLDCSSLVELDLSVFRTDKVKDMSYMFYNCDKLENLIWSKSEFKTDNVTDMSNMFKYCRKLKNLELSNFETSKVIDMSSMFECCSTINELDIQSFNTTNVEDMSNMFYGCDELRNIVWNQNKFLTDNVTDMNDMFGNCHKLEQIDLSGFNTENVTDMSCMFTGCFVLKSLDVSTFNTKKVTDMSHMFSACYDLTSLDLSNFDTSSVVAMGSMFYGCENLEILDISGFDTSNVTSMSSMFMHCYNLKSIIINTETFTTENVTSFQEMFSYCRKLEYFDFSNFDTSNATKMLGMFTWCTSLKELDLSNFTTTCIDMTSPFTLGIDDLEKFTSGKEKRLYKLSTSALGWGDTKGNRYPDDVAIELEPNTTLYRLADTYNINYIYDGDAMDFQDTYKLDETLVLTGYVDKDHYTFDGWYTDEKYTKKITEITAGTYGDITLYAKMIPDTYSITYKNVEDILNAEQLTTSYAYGIEMIPVVPTKTCFLFEGWYLDEELTKVFTGISPTTEGNLLLYAKWKQNHDLDKGNGVILKEATTISEGEIQYKCKNCTYTETEKIPRIVTQESQITDETILNTPDDGDIAGSDFTKFQVRAAKTTKNSIKLRWNKIEGADGYKIYGNRCGIKNPFEYITTIKGEKKTNWTQKKLKKNSYYKYVVRAYKVVDGQEITLAVSKTIHIATAGGTKGNAKAVNIKTDKKCKKTKSGYTLTLKKGKKYTIKVSEKAGAKKINRHRNIRFDSTDKKVATVSKGVVKAKGKGTCYIYAYAQNGVYKKIKVVVK